MGSTLILNITMGAVAGLVAATAYRLIRPPATCAHVPLDPMALGFTCFFMFTAGDRSSALHGNICANCGVAYFQVVDPKTHGNISS